MPPRSERIEGCRSGSGISALNAIDLTVAGTSIVGCPEAGVLAGQGTTIAVSNAIFLNNASHGLNSRASED